MSKATLGAEPDGHMGRRFAAHYEAHPDQVRPLPEDNWAVTSGHSIFAAQVVRPEDSPRLLVSGAHQRKIGERVTKGKWAGMPIYTLTLEERATCPASCEHWRSCYGNSMPYSRRHHAGASLEYLLAQELEALAGQHRAGFVVRLHVLGDFYDVAYAALWHRWMDTFPALHLFGYTAHAPNAGIGWIVKSLNTVYPGRCLIRFSGSQAPSGVPRATTIWRQPEAPRVPEGIVCPAQTGRTACCGTCALCWSTTAPIAFIAHGRRVRGSKEAA